MVAPDKHQAVVFAYANGTIEGRNFPLLQWKALDAKATYKLTTIEGTTLPGTPETASGAWWMNHGMDILLRGDFVAAAFRLDRQ
jgi:alpha-galactosidase